MKMDERDFPTFENFDEEGDSPAFLRTGQDSTATIDLHSLFTMDVTQSGSFDVRSGLWATAFGKLIQALPIPAVLVDRSKTIMIANQACSKINPNYELIFDTGFRDLFPDAATAKRAQLTLERILQTRRPQVMEAVLQMGKGRIWARLSFRSIRIETERHVLVLIEDLTAEKRQLLLQRKHTEELEAEIKRRQRAEEGIRQAHDLLEQRVLERTAELARSNADLTREIAERRRTEERLTLAQRIIEGSNEGVIVTDESAKIVHVNEAFCLQTGHARDDLIGRNSRVLKSGKHAPEFYQEMWESLVSEGEWQGEIWGRRKTGTFYPKLLSVSAIKDTRGHVTHYVGFSSDISKIKQTEEKLQHLAHYDQLTGLANRVLFRDRLERAILQTRRSGGSVALMLLDLDRFKEINDTLGHPTGDKILTSVAQRLKDCVRASDTVGRLGGDEFTVVLPGLRETYEVNLVAKRVLRSLEEPFPINGRNVFISTSMGITICPADGDDVDKLLQNADTALYRAKDLGKNNFQFFSEEMNRELMEKAELETAIREALERNTFNLFYQPIVRFDSGKIVSAEALLRWHHPGLGWIPAERIINLAEESGLILSIGEWVLYHACRQSRLWQEKGLGRLPVAVNVSGHQWARPEFVREVVQVLKDTKLDPSLLELELTESVAMSNLDRTQESFQALRDHGIKIAVDDFGTGYSSLSYLKRLAVDKLKVDRSFVKDIASDSANRAIVSAIVAMGHSLNLKVLAEGVETQEQLGHLWALDCDEWQGYYFRRPMPAEEFSTVWKEAPRGPSFDFSWKPDLSVHVELIDEQHKSWCRKANDLCKSIWSGIRSEELCEFIGFLADYSRLHFSDEESLMREHRYPGYEAHKAAHLDLANRIEQMRQRVGCESIERGFLLDLATDLQRWLVEHFEKVDRDLGLFLQTKL